MEDKKQVASQAYALKHFKGMKDLTIAKESWLDGFEAAKEMGSPKWIKVEDDKPKHTTTVLCFVDNLETGWDGLMLGFYDKKSEEWFLQNSIKGDIAVAWLKMPQIQIMVQ